MRTASLTQLPFVEAATQWLESRRNYISARTYLDYSHYIKTLSGFFGEMQINEIDGDLIRAYQKARLPRAGGALINKEVGIIVQMRKRVGTWAQIAADYQRLPEPKESPGKCITDSEEDRYFRVAAANPAWEMAYHGGMICARTGASPGEVCKLRLCDIDHEHRAIRIVMGAKVKSSEYLSPRIRLVPCVESAWQSVLYLERRAAQLGCSLPDHFLIPYRIHKKRYDPTRPSKGWRMAHHAVCTMIGLRMRPYDWRHTVTTRLLSNPEVSEETAISIMGHISPKMIRRIYNHSRHEVLRAALDTLERTPSKKPPVSHRKQA